MHELTLKRDGSEILEYDYPDFPVRSRDGRLGIFADCAAACHWHRDFEMLRAVDGEMDYFVHGERIGLKAGQAIFVNSGRLHYGYSGMRMDCGYRFVVFHPLLLGSFAPVEAMVNGLIASDNRDWWLFDEQDETGRRAIEHMEAVYQASRDGDTLSMQAHCTALTHIVWTLSESKAPRQQDEEWETMKRMTGYIQEHYAERITLADIAAAGAVCRSLCCRMFREKLGATPNQYLTQYRLDKVCALLLQGKAITDAALTCGFHSGSYLAELFKKTYGMTPRAYRERHVSGT